MFTIFPKRSRLMQCCLFGVFFCPATLAFRSIEGAGVERDEFFAVVGRGVKPSLNCSVEPVEVFAGESVTLTIRGMDLPQSKGLSYQWTVSGGDVAEHENTATVDTKGLAVGSYAAYARLVDKKKALIVASCSTNFVVKLPNPPTILCAVSRAAIHSGDPVTITATADGAAGSLLNYSYATTNGQVDAHGASALLSTVGATPGAITVTCTVADEVGRTASATASVVVATPAAAPPSATVQKVCGLSFERDRRRPDRVDNEAKGCLDEVALDLKRDTGAMLLIVGHRDAREGRQHAALRALNASRYLVKEQGIDPVRLEVMMSDVPGRRVDNTLIPQGQTLDSAGEMEVGRAVTRRSKRPVHAARMW